MGGPHIVQELPVESHQPPSPINNERSLKGAKLDQKLVLYFSHQDGPRFRAKANLHCYSEAMGIVRLKS